MPLASKLGFVLFGVLLVVRIVAGDHYPDDAVTSAMKRSGIYGYVAAAMVVMIVASLTWLAIELRRTARAQARLDRARASLARALRTGDGVRIPGRE